MRRGTTPTLTLTIDEIDLTKWQVYLTFAWGKNEMTKTNDDLTINSTENGCEIVCKLSQTDTLYWTAKEKVRVQIRATNGADAIATNITTLTVDEILKDGEI